MRRNRRKNGLQANLFDFQEKERGRKMLSKKQLDDISNCEDIDCKNCSCRGIPSYSDEVLETALKLYEKMDEMAGIDKKLVLCTECLHSTISTTTDYAYRCQNKSSPCRNRVVFIGFGCTCGECKK